MATGEARAGGEVAKPKKRGKPKARGNGQGTVYERPNGTYQTQVTLPDGRRVTVTGKTKREAERKRAAMITDAARGVFVDPQRVTVAEYAARWLERQATLRPKSIKLYRGELAYALEHVGKMRVQRVEPHHLKDLMVALSNRVMQGGRGKGKTMAPRTQGQVLARLKAVFREAVADRILHASPAEGVKKVKAPPLEAVGRVLDFPEAARFREVGEALHATGLCGSTSWTSSPGRWPWGRGASGPPRDPRAIAALLQHGGLERTTQRHGLLE